MNVTHRALMNAVVAALQGYGWPALGGVAPAVKKGPQTAVSETGPVVIVTLGTYPAESVGPNNTAKFTHVVEILGVVPWDDTDANEDLRSNLATDIYGVIAHNRRPGGTALLRVRSMDPGHGRLFGPNESMYRWVQYLCEVTDTQTV